MKLKRKNRIITTNNHNTNNIIFMGSQCTINSKKTINLNHTKLYYKNEHMLVPFKKKKATINNISLEYNIDTTNILEIINIYNNNLFIVILDYNTKLNTFKEKKYLDLFTPISTSIYNDIYRYNKLSNCYLGEYLTNNKNTIKLRVIDLYYYLIGYT